MKESRPGHLRTGGICDIVSAAGNGKLLLSNRRASGLPVRKAHVHRTMKSDKPAAFGGWRHLLSVEKHL